MSIQQMIPSSELFCQGSGSEGFVAIVGGGITGLSAALRLRECYPHLQFKVLESSPRLGGVLQTRRDDGFLIEGSADSFITTVPWALELCRRLDLEARLISTDPTRRRAFVVHQGQLKPIPEGLMLMAPSRLGPILTSSILSWRGKLRMLRELWVRPGSGADESLASFAVRRFGREAYERLIQPLVGGIYTADPEQLSLKATMARFLDLEQTHGSLIRSTWHRGAGGTQPAGSESGARYGMFVTPRGGMSELIEMLARRLPADSVRCRTTVEQIQRGQDGRWSLLLTQAEGREWLNVDGVILATPAPRAGKLLAGIDPELSSQVRRIPSAGCAIVSMGYQRQQIAHPLDGFGFVVPMVERRSILSGSFSSVKFAGRSPAGCVLLRVFLGGALRPELLELGDEELTELAGQELAGLLGICGKPLIQHIDRWSEVMPQYEVGHVDRIAAITARLQQFPGLALAGNAYQGVGIPHCIHSGERAADRVADDLNTVQTPPIQSLL